jgi:hypothetical protein
MAAIGSSAPVSSGGVSKPRPSRVEQFLVHGHGMDTLWERLGHANKQPPLRETRAQGEIYESMRHRLPSRLKPIP